MHFEVYVNLVLAMRQSMDIQRFLSQVLQNQQASEQVSHPYKQSLPFNEVTFANQDIANSD